MNKFQFIKHLMETRKFTSSQMERFLKLASEQIGLMKPSNEELWEEIKKIKEKLGENQISKNDSNTPKSFEILHNPIYISKYLKKFKENTDLKWTTHPWDNKKYATIDAFINALNSDKEFYKLFNYNRDLYNLINYFIYNPKTDLNADEVPQYGWPYFSEMKVGWQFPENLLIKWSRENFDKKDEVEAKTPFQYIIPKNLRPKKLVKGKEIKTFEDVVEAFKTEIQFRENYFYKEILKRKNKMCDFQFLGLEEFEKLDFYTYTSGVLNAIDVMLDQIKKNEIANKIRFSHQFFSDYIIVDVTQIDSFPTRKLSENNLKQFIGGGLNDIASSLFSLADFSVRSTFYDNIPGEIIITDSVSIGELKGKHLTILTSPTFNQIDDKQNGFTYRMKFYI